MNPPKETQATPKEVPQEVSSTQATPKEAEKKSSTNKGASKFEVTGGAYNKYQWKFIGPDGSLVLERGGFSNKNDVFAAIRAIKENATFSGRYERRAQEGKSSFVLKSASHLTLAQSGLFEKTEDRDRAIAIVRTAPEAAVIDRSS